MTACLRKLGWAFLQDRRGASAVEFALVSIPFILMLLITLQMGIYYMAQSSLDAGVSQTADYLVNTFYSCTPPVPGSTACNPITPPTQAQVKAMVYAQSGGLIRNDTNFHVEFQDFNILTTSVRPITDNASGNIATYDVASLRAQGSIPIFVPFVPGLGLLETVRSTTLVRRQNF